MPLFKPKTFHKTLEERHWLSLILSIVVSFVAALGLFTVWTLLSILVFGGAIFQVGVAVASGIVAATLLATFGALKIFQWTWSLP